MKSYVAVTFTFLAIAFYQLSGGADYAPRAGSLQVELPKLRAEQAVRMAEMPRAQLPKPASARSAATPAMVTRATMAVPAGTAVATTVTPKALAPVIPPVLPAVAVATGPAEDAAPTDSQQQRLEGYSLARLSPAAVDGIAQELQAGDAPAQTAGVAADVPRDIRRVEKSRVNLRMGPGTQYDVVMKLDAGAQVDVLETTGDGWVKLRVLDTGRIGWMAETLITAAN